VALQLRKHGIRHVRPLLGGNYERKRLGFPLVEITVVDEEEQALGAKESS